MLDWIKKNKFLVSVFLLTIILRLPSLFEPYWYGDEGVYLTIGQGIRKGLLLYKDIYDNKPPLIYLLAALAGNLFWFRFILLIFNLASSVLIYDLSRLFFPKNNLIQKLTTVLFAVLSSIPLLEGNIANAEILQLLPTLLAVWLLFRKEKPISTDYFLSGLFFSLSALFKIPTVFDLAATVIFLVLFENQKKLLNLDRRIVFLAAGFLVPFLLTFSFFWFHHYLKESAQIIFTQNLGYLSSWKTGTHKLSIISILKSGLIYKGLTISIFLGAIWSLRKRVPSKKDIFILIWFVFTLVAATLSGRPYAHYLIQIFPSFVFLIGLTISNNKAIRYFASALLIILVFLAIKTKFWIYPVFPYYQNFGQFISGGKSKQSYFAYFDKRIPVIYEAANFLVDYTKPNEKIFIWANEPYLYPLTKKLPVGKYTVAYHIIDFNKFKEVTEILKASLPRVIVFDSQKTDVFSELESLINQKYLLITNFGNFNIFRLRSKDAR